MDELKPSEQIDQHLDRLHGIKDEIARLFGEAEIVAEAARRVALRAEEELMQRSLNYYTEEEVAEKCKVSEATIARLRKQRKISYVDIGKVRYTEAQVAQIANELTVEAIVRRSGLREAK